MTETTHLTGKTRRAKAMGMVREYFSILGLVMRLYILPTAAFGLFMLCTAWAAMAVLTPIVDEPRLLELLTFACMMAATVLVAAPVAIYAYGMTRQRGPGE